MTDVLGGDRRFAVFLLKPGQEAELQGSPAPFEVGCLGEIVRADALPDGRFNVLLMGLVRIRIEEFLTEVPYRVVGASLAPEHPGKVAEPPRDAFRRLVGGYFRRVLGRSSVPAPAGESLDALVNTAAASVETNVYERQTLLEAVSIEERMLRVAELMREQLDAHRVIDAARATRPPDPRLN